MTPNPDNQLVAIVGGSGAGKSWLTERLVRLLGEQACYIALDDFYHDHSDLPVDRRAELNFDTPAAIDWQQAKQTLQDCQAGRPTRMPRYDFGTHQRLPSTDWWQPKPLALVEGLPLLVHAPIRELFTFKIYLDCPTELRLQRRLDRDVTDRGRTPDSVIRQFENTVNPMHALHIEPQQQWADIVLAQPFRKADLKRLANRLWLLLTDVSPLPEWLRLPFHSELFHHLEFYDHHN